MTGESPTCFTLPAVTSGKYKSKGIYQKINGLDVYVTGHSSADKAILHVYDIFGITPQTVQGADRLATALGALVVMPDWFKGEPMLSEWMPPDTDEKKALVEKFRSEKSGNPDNLKIMLQTAEEAKKEWPEVKRWGTFGLCWGGKLSVQASGPDTMFKVSGQAHPSRLARSDAEALTIPHIALMSKGEPADLVKEYEEVLNSPGKTGQVEKYLTMHHGWMGGRANLEDEENLKEYERGYDQIAAFFAKHL